MLRMEKALLYSDHSDAIRRLGSQLNDLFQQDIEHIVSDSEVKANAKANGDNDNRVFSDYIRIGPIYFLQLNIGFSKIAN